MSTMLLLCSSAVFSYIHSDTCVCMRREGGGLCHCQVKNCLFDKRILSAVTINLVSFYNLFMVCTYTSLLVCSPLFAQTCQRCIWRLKLWKENTFPIFVIPSTALSVSNPSIIAQTELHLFWISFSLYYLLIYYNNFLHIK